MVSRPILLAILMAFSCAAFSQCANDSLQLYPPGDFNYLGTGFSDASDLPCAVNGAYCEIVIPFKAYSGGTRALATTDSTFIPVSRVYAVRIDGVSGLPSGLCWSVKAPDNTVSGDNVGALIIKGTTTASSAVYPLDVTVSLDVEGNGTFTYSNQHPQNYKAILGHPAVKVADASGNCPSVN